MSSLAKSLDQQVPIIKAMQEKALDKPRGLVQSTVDDIKVIALDNDLAYWKIVCTKNHGIHPKNRGGSGCDAFNAQKLLLEISNRAFSHSKLEDPMGFEPGNGNIGEEQKEFMEKAYSDSAGYLKKVEWHDCEYLPITFTHTAAASNLSEGGQPGLYEELCDTNMIINNAKVLQLCPSWEKSRKGFKCLVFRRELEERLPDLPCFLSQAGNQTHDSHQTETKPQLMLAIHSMYMVEKKKNENAKAAGKEIKELSWVDIVAKVEGMKPQFENKALDASEFLKKWSGGDDAKYLHEIDVYGKALKSRFEPDNGQLSLLAKAALLRQPLWPPACIKACISAPDLPCFVYKGESKLFTSSDVQAMPGKKLPLIEEACKLMTMARTWLKTDTALPEVCKLLGDMDVRCVMFVHDLQKKVKTRTQFASLNKIAEQFALDAKQMGADMQGCPWTPTEPLPKKASSTSSMLVQMGDGGRIELKHLNESGYKLGAKVEAKVKPESGQKPIVYHIAAIGEAAVGLIDGNNEHLSVTPAALIDTYKVVKIAEDSTVSWDKLPDPTKKPDAEEGRVRSLLKHALTDAFRSLRADTKIDFTAVKGTQKHIFAAAKYLKGSLKLVGYSPYIGAWVDGTTLPQTAVLTELTYTDSKSKTVTLFASPKFPEADKETGSFSNAIIIPYWLVQDTGDEAAANMEAVSVKVDVATSIGKDVCSTEGVSVPAMRNTRVVQAGEELLRFNPKLVKGPEVGPGSVAAKKKAVAAEGPAAKKKKP